MTYVIYATDSKRVENKLGTDQIWQFLTPIPCRSREIQYRHFSDVHDNSIPFTVATILYVSKRTMPPRRKISIA